MRPVWFRSLAPLALVLTFSAAHAQQAWPVRPVKTINPFLAGGPSDVLGRIVNDKLGQRLGQPFVMDNRPGAGGNIGIDAAMKAAPDGYTLAWVVDFNLTVNPSLYPKMPYVVEKDLQTVATFALGEVALVVHPSVAANSLAELIALARAKPLAFASGGNGTPGHMVGELFKRELKLDTLTHVPYKGNAPATQSIVAGETQLFFGALPGSLAHVRAGKLRPLAVLSARRSPYLPDVPTSAELGFPKLYASNWYGLVAPAGTPKDVVDRLQKALAAILNERDVVERIDKMALIPYFNGPEQMRGLIRSEGATWGAVVRAANIRPE